MFASDSTSGSVGYLRSQVSQSLLGRLQLEAVTTSPLRLRTSHLGPAATLIGHGAGRYHQEQNVGPVEVALWNPRSHQLKFYLTRRSVMLYQCAKSILCVRIRG